MNQIDKPRKLTFEQLSEAGEILKIISHPVRLEILWLLESRDEMDVSSICEQTSKPCEISMISHHLAKMKGRGLLASNKKGKQVYYSLADRRVLKILDCIEKYNAD